MLASKGVVDLNMISLLQLALSRVFSTTTRTTRVSRYQKKHSPIHTYRSHQSSLICFLHLLQSMASSLFTLCACQSFYTISVQVLFSLVYLLAWHPPLHTPYISSPNYCLLFTAHANTVTTCFAVVPRLCPLILVSQPLLGSWKYLVTRHTSILPFSSLPVEVPPQFPFLRARSYFCATYYFAHNCCTVSLSLSMIYPYW